jgi:hypothetical protein
LEDRDGRGREKERRKEGRKKGREDQKVLKCHLYILE